MSTENTETKAPTPQEMNEALIERSKHWKLDGDLMRCRKCNRAIIHSRRGEDMIHAADCPNKDMKPWAIFETELAAILRGLKDPAAVMVNIIRGEINLPHHAMLKIMGDEALEAVSEYPRAKSELAAAQAQNLALRHLVGEIIPRYQEMFEALNLGDFQDSVIADMANKALSAPPPPVVSREEHARVVKELDAEKQATARLLSEAAADDREIIQLQGRVEEAEQDADRLADLLKSNQYGGDDECQGCGHPNCCASDCQWQNAITAHEARKGGKA